MSNTVFMLPIKNFDGYFAGDDGNVYSTKKTNLPVKLKGSPTKTSNYLRLNLCKNHKKYGKDIHVLICSAFNGEK